MASFAVWLAIIVGIPVFLWLWLVPDFDRGPSASVPCEEAPTPSDNERLAEGVVPTPLILEKPEGVVINFWRNRGVQRRTIYLQVAKKSPPKGDQRYAILQVDTDFIVSQRPLERQELDGVIGPLQYEAAATVNSRKDVALTVCVDATEAGADPGTYRGSVRLLGAGIQPVIVPVSVTLQYPGFRWIVPVMAVVVFLAGSFLVWASTRKAAIAATSSSETDSVWKSVRLFPGWILDNYVGVVAGVIAAISVFIAKYWRNAPWGAMAPEDWFALLGGLFTAYTTALTAGSALVTPQQRKTQGS